MTVRTVRTVRRVQRPCRATRRLRRPEPRLKPRRWRSARHRGAEQGAATVVMLGVIGAVVAVFLAGVSVASATIASHRARAAADLGALAGASALGSGGQESGACVRAAVVVRRNGATLDDCRVLTDGSVELVTECPWSAPWPVRPPATARARAGPEGGAGTSSG